MIGKIIGYFDGWKTIAGYISAELLAVIGLGNDPLVVDAVKKVIENPSDVFAWAYAGGIFLMNAGLIHKAVKEIKK